MTKTTVSDNPVMSKVTSSDKVLIPRFNIVLYIASIASFVLIIGILLVFSIDAIVPPSGTVGSYINYGKIVKTLAFLYGTVFAPGLIVSVVFSFYIRRRRRGGNRSYLLEVLMIVVAAQTVFTFFIIQNV